MALTTFGIVFLIGATLGLRFRVLILFLAIGWAAVGTARKCGAGAVASNRSLILIWE
jgi:hypothetical protein